MFRFFGHKQDICEKGKRRVKSEREGDKRKSEEKNT